MNKKNDRNFGPSGIKTLSALLAPAALLFALAPQTHAAIVQIDPATLSNNAVVDFEDLGLRPGQQVTYGSIFESGFTQFGESFVGQSVSQSGNFDVLTGTPSDPLALATGPANQNVTAVDGGAGDIGNTAISGSGPEGYPAANAVGEGAIAILFDFDQSEFGFDIVGSDGGTATAQFWERDGSLIDELILDLGLNVFDSFGFMSDDDSFSIAGVSIFNDDPGGIGFDNFVSDVVGVPGPPPVTDPGTDPEPQPEPPGVPVPESSPLALLALSLLGLGLFRRR